MIHDDSNPFGIAPARGPSSGASEQVPPPVLGSATPTPADLPEPPLPPSPQSDTSVPEDLRSPWGWLDLLAFIGFGFLGLLVAAGIVVAIAAAGFGVRIRDLGQLSASPAKSMIAVLAQGVWSGFVLLYFYTLVRIRTHAPFWRTMGWR